jgi:hypothetical protein
VDESSVNATTIAGLAGSAQFMEPLACNQSVLSGVLARTVNRKTDPIDQKAEFSRADSRGMLLITWLPVGKRKGRPSLRLYDLDNRLLNEIENKKKITVTPSKLSYSASPLGVTVQPSDDGMLLPFDLLPAEKQSWFVGDLTFTPRPPVNTIGASTATPAPGGYQNTINDNDKSADPI